MRAKILTSFAILIIPFTVSCETKTETEIVYPECSAANPAGVCDVGESCMEGTCMPAEAVCSPTNFEGACPSGMTCFSGGCVPEQAVCSEDHPTGPCEMGETCVEGECVVTSAMCSTSNPTGLCPTGEECSDGVCAPPGVDPCTVRVYSAQPAIGVDTRTKLNVDGLTFKDSSGNGQLDVYEDWRLSEYCRAKDLAAKMSVPEKVGLMSEGSRIGSGTPDGVIAEDVLARLTDDHIRQALIRLGRRSATELAVYLNNVQKVCEAEPWGIPFVVTTDPSHGFGMSTNATTGEQTLSASSVVSPWPYPLGLGAINDAAVTRQYGDMVRHEFMAMGFRWQLGPMADLGTEPRWARVQNVFGENAFHVAKHVRACVSGFQGVGDGGLRNGIVATMKHFPGAGADEDGMDSHSRPGRYNIYPGDLFEYHQIPFQAAIDVGVAAVMPCYSIFKEQTDFDPEQVGAAFSDGLITHYLKQELGFTGMVTSDWGTMSGTPWGVEMLTPPERAAKFVKAGSHQLGSDSHTLIQDAYDQGLLSDADIDEAAIQIREMSFKLGLFENPYVDETAAATVVRSVENRRNGFIAQKKAIVLLKNSAHEFPPPGRWDPPVPGYLPIDPAAYDDANENGTPDVGEYTCDTDSDGVVEVYYDGVTDGLVVTDQLDDFLGMADYSSGADGDALPVVSVASAADADIAVLRITARKGSYFGLDAGVPLSFDAPFPGTQNDSGLRSAIKDRDKVIDLLRIRDGYVDATGTAIPAAKPTLRIVLVMHMDRPGIVKPFIDGLSVLDETFGEAGSYPLVSDPANIRADGLGGVDGFLVEFGAFDRAVLDVLFNVNVPTVPDGYEYGTARLPMEIPSSDAEVDAQFEDVPADTMNATFGLGAGMTY